MINLQYGHKIKDSKIMTKLQRNCNHFYIDYGLIYACWKVSICLTLLKDDMFFLLNPLQWTVKEWLLVCFEGMSNLVRYTLHHILPLFPKEERSRKFVFFIRRGPHRMVNPLKVPSSSKSSSYWSQIVQNG